MSAQQIDALKIPDSAAILQLNFRRSPSIINSLFNDENITNFLFLALQEPPVNPHTNTPSEQSGWYLVVSRPQDLTERSRPRSCLYVNSNLNADIRPITSVSRDVASCVIKLHDLHLLLVNVYNQPRTFDGFDAMDNTLKSLPLSVLHLPTVIVTDSNLHSPLWNPTGYPTHDASADALVESMTKWDLYLR